MNVIAWLEPEFCLRLTWTLLHFLWQGVAIAALVMLVGWSLRGVAANLRHSIHVGALVLMAACLPITFALVNVPRPELPPVETAVVMDESPPVVSTVDLAADEVRLSPSRELPDLPDQGEIVSLPTVQAEQHQEAEVPVATTSVPPESRASILARAAPYAVVIYLGGLVAMLLKFAVGLWGGHRLRTGSVAVSDSNLLAMLQRLSDRLRLRVTPAIAVCQRVSVPIVIGVVKPVILLPAALATSLSPHQLEALLTHELAHIRRCDLLVNVLQRLIKSVLFFHPAVWYVSRRVSIEREHACDDFVVSSGWRKTDYAAALVGMAELCAASPPVGVGALAASGNKPSQFKLRIQRLMNTAEDSRLRLTRVGMAGLLLTLALLITVPSIAHSLAQDQPASAKSESNDPGRRDEPGQSNSAQPAPTESKQAAVPTLREPAFLLPDHWIIESVGFDNMSKELVTASKQSFVTIRRWDVVDRKLISEIKLTSDKHARPNTVRHESC